jgi:serine/threonine-protein kinase RsbW
MVESHGMGEFRARFPSKKSSVARARRAVVAFIAGCGFGVMDLADIETAVGEALANAVEHGHAVRSEIAVSVDVDDAGATIEVEDAGRGFDHTAHRRPSAARAPRGFGISIMRRLMDRVEYNERGNVIRLVKKRRRTAERDAGAQGA